MSSPPSYYDVINQKASAFIAKPDCQYHVSLLHTFHQLRISDPEVEKVYLARAEARYFLWMNHVQSYEPSNYLLPPIDVVYMWHAHLLSPFRYHENILRNGYDTLHTKAYGLPLERLEWAKTTFADGVDPDSEQYWSKFFPDQPYKLTTANLDEGQSEIICPGCQSQIRSSWTDYGKMRTDKKAFLHCKNCSANVTVEALACGRFAKDWLESTPTDLKLAGFQLGRSGKPLKQNPKDAQGLITLRDARKVLAVLHSKNILSWMDILAAIRTQTVVGITDPRNIAQITIAAIIHSRYKGIPYNSSLDIIIAVTRQWEFTAKMVEIDWTTEELVADAVLRYYKFLMLMKDHPKSILVPVLSIDLAWHTHMLNHYNYRKYTLKHLDLVVNHDDTIASGTSNDHLVSTAKLWYEKYREPYTSDDLEKISSETNKQSSFFANMQKQKLKKYWYQSKETEKKGSAVKKDHYVEHNTANARPVFSAMVMSDRGFTTSMEAALGAATCQMGSAENLGAAASNAMVSGRALVINIGGVVTYAPG